MNKTDILVELHGVIATRLFGGGPWLMDRKSAAASQARARELRLEEQVEDGGSQLTCLGKDINFILLSVFMGAWDEGDIPTILRMHGLITASEADSMDEEWAKFPTNPELAMKSYVRKAYVRCFKPKKKLA